MADSDVVVKGTDNDGAADAALPQPQPQHPDGGTAYNEAYFDRWYRDADTSVSSAASTLRKAAMALAVAEYYLERPVRTVLDVGCGEGNWLVALQTLRPETFASIGSTGTDSVAYTGVDSSGYAVDRFGESRNIHLGSMGSLAADAERIGLAEETKYDLIVCSDALSYIESNELETGLAYLSNRTDGVAFLEIYTDADKMEGDVSNIWRPADFYRALLRRHGFVSVGSHCYLGPTLSHQATEMER
jgi:SAM-dependent methyltransferase